MKTITLSVPNRIILKSVLPQEGGLIEMTVVKSISDKLKFTENEIQEFELKDIPNNGVSFNRTKIKDLKFDLTMEQVEIIKAIPERLDRTREVKTSMFELFEIIKGL